MSKNREDQVAEPQEPKTRREAPAHEETDEGDEAPDVSTRKDGDRTVVEGTGETRGERRRRQREERLAAERAEKEQTASTIAELRRTVEGLSSRLAAPAQPQVAVQPAGKVDPEWKRLTRRQIELSKLMQNASTPQETDRIMDEWQEVEYEKQQIVAKKTLAPDLERVRAQSVPQEPMEITQLRHEFRDVLANPKAARLAQAYAGVIQASMQDGQYKSPAEIHRAAITRAAIELGLRQAPSSAPSNAQRGRFASAAPGGSGSSSGFSRPLSRRELRLAKVWADGAGIPEEDAATAWVKAMTKDDPNFFRDNEA